MQKNLKQNRKDAQKMLGEFTNSQIFQIRDIIQLSKMMEDIYDDDSNSDSFCIMTEQQKQKVDQIKQLIQNTKIHTYSKQQKLLVQYDFALISDMLLKTQDGQIFYLQLSECKVEQKKFYHTGYLAYGLELTNFLGKTILVFFQYDIHKIWYKALKQYCKLSFFTQKFQLGEQILPNYFIAIRKKNRKQYTVHIQKQQELKISQDIQEVVLNEIHLLRSLKHQSLMDLKGVYEDNGYTYKLFEYFQGQSVQQLLENDLVLDEIQLASLIFQILSLLKFLHVNLFYHGNISPTSCIINTNHQMLQILLIESTYKQYKESQTNDWMLLKTTVAFIAPEVIKGGQSGIISDLYSLGALLYYISFINFQLNDKLLTSTQKLQQLKINFSQIQQAQNALQEGLQNESKERSNQMIFSISQLDLMSRLLQDDPHKRMNLEEALKHHWFINVKNKLKQTKTDRKSKMISPNLMTIIELRESDGELRLSSNFSKNKMDYTPEISSPNPTPKYKLKQQSFRFDEEEQVLDENAGVYLLMQSLNKHDEQPRPSKQSHGSVTSLTRFIQFDTTFGIESKFDFSKSNTFSVSYKNQQ